MDSFLNEEDPENTNRIMSISLQVASITYVIQQ